LKEEEDRLVKDTNYDFELERKYKEMQEKRLKRRREG